MNMRIEKRLGDGWSLVRDAGDTAMYSRLGTGLANTYPRVKEWASHGAVAGIQAARRGTRVATGAVRRHPVATTLGVVALAGLGLLVLAARRASRPDYDETESERSAGTQRGGNGSRGKRVKVTNLHPGASAD